MRGSNEEQRRLTRECLYEALISLWDYEPYDKISITDLTRKAGVSRMAFYRNYESKDQIVIDRLRELNDEYLASLERDGDMRIDEFVSRFYCYMANNARFMKKALDAGFSWVLVSLIDEYMQSDGGLKPSDVDVAGFQNENLRRFIAGGYLNMVKEWLDAGMRETPRQMGEETAIFVKRLLGSAV